MKVMPWDRKKISEKTLELNFASQLNHRIGGNLLWFGLTQKQEAEAGFDIATRVGQDMFIVQMKASANILKKSKARQFKIPHDQLQSLLRLQLPLGHVFYAFPLIGTTQDLATHQDVVGNTWLCDITLLKNVDEPLTRTGTPRKDGCHYVQVTPAEAPISPLAAGRAVFHSKPVTVDLVLPDQALTRDPIAGEREGNLLSRMDGSFEFFWSLFELFQSKALVIIRVG
ncbi:hypothetical protein [uncultured Thiocystis sp.]|jgi:hypothetical protein|uniref:hypothetical protein n=1 Tax=uncultured Thiocystis sp. TaxID=1202134 RepID=UPI0025FC5232|nr:hypothetical protein [uncultured Thiocystis sp.]